MDTDRRQLVGRFVDNARLASGLKTRLDRVANLVSDAETSLKRLRENASKPSLPFGTQAMRLNTNLIAIEKGYADWQNLMRKCQRYRQIACGYGRRQWSLQTQISNGH